MKSLIGNLRGILVSNAIIAAIMNRQSKEPKKLEELEPPKAGWKPDMDQWVNAKPLEEERVELSVTDIKQIMDEHEVRMRYRAMVNDQPALEVISQNEGRYYRETAPADVAKQMIDAIYDGIPQSQVSLGFAGQVMANNMAVKAMLDPKHERDTQAVRSPGFGFQNTDRSTATHPDLYPNQSFSTPVEFENRAQRRRREQEEKRNKKRGKK